MRRPGEWNSGACRRFRGKTIQ